MSFRDAVENSRLGSSIICCVAALAITGCGTAADEKVSRVSLYNDTNRVVVLSGCDGADCIEVKRISEEQRRRDLWPPMTRGRGGSNVSGVGVPTVIQVRDSTATRLLGCLPIVVPNGPVTGLVARVSQRVPCRVSYDEDVPWPPKPE